MKGFSYVLQMVVGCLLWCCSPAETPIEQSLRRLDDSIANRGAIRERKEKQLQQFRALVEEAKLPHERYKALSALYNAYRNYNVDSTLHYALLKKTVALSVEDPLLIQDATLDIVSISAINGFYVEALRELEKLDTARLSPEIYQKYLQTRVTLYDSMVNTYCEQGVWDNYSQTLVGYREKLLPLLDADSPDFLIMLISLERETGGVKKESIVSAENRLAADESLSLHERAVLSYVLSHAYEENNDPERALYHLVQAAIYDISTPVREHKSLYELADKLFAKGDIERAYRYIDTSIEDLSNTKARVQMQSLEDLIPGIISAYNAKKESDRFNLMLLLVLVSVVAVLLIVLLLLLSRAKKKVQQSNRRTEEMNAALNETNNELCELNRRIAESDNVKEIYIGQYIEMCSSYIERMEKYRANLLNVSRTKGAKELTEALKSSSFISSELSDFYLKFDVSFLHIYPNFVEEFNSLLREECRFDITPGKPLNTELRVFALIRLGITDSNKIAEFLRRSVSTIYNYRVKMRNAAKFDREDFEKQVMKIGKNDFKTNY